MVNIFYDSNGASILFKWPQPGKYSAQPAATSKRIRNLNAFYWPFLQVLAPRALSLTQNTDYKNDQFDNGTETSMP